MFVFLWGSFSAGFRPVHRAGGLLSVGFRPVVPGCVPRGTGFLRMSQGCLLLVTRLLGWFLSGLRYLSGHVLRMSRLPGACFLHVPPYTMSRSHADCVPACRTVHLELLFPRACFSGSARRRVADRGPAPRPFWYLDTPLPRLHARREESPSNPWQGCHGVEQ